MRSWIRKAVTGATLLGLLAMIVSMSAAAGSASATGTNWGGGGGGFNLTSPAFNTSQNAPHWNTGNLCSIVKSGASVWCTYSGPSNSSSGQNYSRCGCTPQLTENLSGFHKTFYITISNLSRAQNEVYLNVKGSHDTVVLNVTGTNCTGGFIDYVELGERNTLDFNLNGSGFSGLFSFYLDHNSYNANIVGNLDTFVSEFAGVGIKQNQCPWANMSRTDTMSVIVNGSFDSQFGIWANAENYTTSAHITSLGSGYWDHIGWENTTFLVCSWAHAPSCHGYSGHHYGPNLVLGRANRA